MADVVRLPARVDLGRPWQPSFPSQILERPPPRQWLLDGLIQRGRVTLLAGGWKLGKSLLAQQLLTAVAMGVPCIGRHTERAKVFGYFCEDEEDDLAGRQFDINAGLSVEMIDLEDRFAWRSMAGDECVLASAVFGKMTETGEWHHLWREIDDLGSELIVIDTARAVFGGSEINPNHVTWFMRKLHQQAMKAQRAILLLLHPPKGDQGGWAGSGAWLASARGGGLSLRRPPEYDEEKDEPRFDRVLRGIGANYSAGRSRIKLIWKDGVFITDEPDNPPPRAFGLFSQGVLDAELLEGLRKCRRNGARVPADVLAAGSLPRRYRATFDRRTSLNDLYAAQERLIASGKVIRVAVDGQCLLRPADGLPYPREGQWGVLS